MATSPKRPIRLRILDQEGVANYPNELLSDFDNKKLALYDADHNKMIEFFADLDTEVTGNGNAITELTVSGNKITAVKTETFLTGHPDVETAVDTTSTQAGKFGETVTIVDSVVRDTDGHVTKINLKTLTLPTETELSVNSSGTGNAVTGVSADGHTITLEKNATFLTDHPVVTMGKDGTVTEYPTHGETFTAVGSVTKDANGHVTAVTTKTIKLPDVSTGIEVEVVGSGNAITDASAVGNTITLTRMREFLEEHPAIDVSEDKAYDEGDWVAVGNPIDIIDNIERDSNGHVLHVDTKKVTMKFETTTSGDGNAVTNVEYDKNTGAVNVYKNKTFLEEHPATTMAKDTTTTASPAEGGSFDVIDGVTKDTNGHVTKVNTKTVTLPTHKDPDLVIAASTGNGNAITQLEVSGHTITPVKGFSFLTSHPDIDQSENGWMDDQKPGYGGVVPALRDISMDMYGHIKKMIFQNIYMPEEQTDITGNAGTASKLKTPIAVNVSGAVTGSATSVDGSSNVNIVTTKIDASKIEGVIPIENIPQAALERLIPVTDDTARLKLTANDAQNGDVVKVTSTGLMYYVVDQTKLGTEAAFETFTAGTASAVEWSGITNKPTFATVATSGKYDDLIGAPGVAVTSEGTGNAVTAITQNGHGIKLTKGATFSLSTHTHAEASTTAAGLMSAGDKTKLAGIAEGANKTVVDSALSADSTNPVQNKVVKAALDGKSDTSHTHNYAGSSSAGGAANSVKSNMVVKLNGGTTEGTDMFTFNGSTAKSVNITAAGIGAAAASHTHDDRYYTESEVDTKLAGKSDTTHTHAEATTTTAGLMSAADKAKLNSVASDATKVTIDSALSATSTNPVQNKVVKAALDGKSDTSHTHTYTDVGAAAASHTHDDRYYTETEMNTKLAGKSDTTHTHAEATTTTAGLMSAADKTKLTGIAEGANNTVVDSALNTTSTNPVQNKVIKSALDGKADTGHTHNYAGSSSAGGAANSVKSSMVVKLNGGTTEGTDMFTFNGSTAKSVNITAASVGAAASSHTHDDRYYTESEVDMALLYKSDVSHTHNHDEVGAAAAVHNHDDRYYTESEVDTKLAAKANVNHTHDLATPESDGFMSGQDKDKLEGIEAEANKTIVEDAFYTNSEYPVQSQVIKSALDALESGKADTDHTHYYADIGAAAAEHNHNDLYYDKDTVDGMVSNRAMAIHSHDEATTSEAGFMSAADKTKLNSLNNITVDAALDSTSTNPVQNKVVNSAIAGKATTAVYTASIGTSWSGTAAPYTQTITVTGITANDTPIVDVNLSSIDYANKESVISAWSSVYRITTAANSITVYADEKTETAIPIQLKVVR